MSRECFGIEDGIPGYQEVSYSTTQATATLICRLEDQADRGNRIDPAGMSFDPGAIYPVSWEFDHSRPPIGRARMSRADDGTILAHVELFDAVEHWGHDIQPKLAAQVRMESEDIKEGVIAKSDLLSAALCRQHADPEQPPIVFTAIATIRSKP